MFWQMSRWMQEEHLRLNTLESIVEVADATAKIETQNFGNKKIYYGKYISVNEIEFTFTIFFIGFVLYEIKRDENE